MLSHLEDEATLVAEAQSGDAKAFAALMSQYESHVYHLALNITRNPQDAEDALQDAFLKAYAHLGEFRGDSRFSTWLVKIATNTALTKMRQRSSEWRVSSTKSNQTEKKVQAASLGSLEEAHGGGRMTKHILLGLCLWAACAGKSLADGITFTFMAINFPGQLTTQAFGINDAGQIVGSYSTNGGHGFLDSGGSFATVDVPSGIDTSALGISSSGYIVGQYFPAGTTDTQGFLDKGGSFTTISFPGALASDASGVNGSGEMVGSYIDTGLNEHGYVDINGAFGAINFPGAALTEVKGVNASGEIVGFYDADGHEHGFLDRAGVFSSIDFPGATSTEAWGINGSGEIVGLYGDANGQGHGFVDIGGVFSTVDFPGSLSTSIRGVNDQGQVVGNYFDAEGGDHGFVATQTPEPATFGTMVSGVLLVLARRRRRAE